MADVILPFRPQGGALELFRSREPEILLCGPAGTGKSRTALEKLHLMACKYAGMRGLMARKTLRSLVASTLVTYREKVLHKLDGVSFFGGSSQEPAAFRYPNGSRLVVGGLDNPDKVMSTEYDAIYVSEATDLVENDLEALTTRLRNGVMPYQQLLGDCNPGAPTHWLKRRCDRGATRLLDSRHEDNPALWDARAGAWTPAGVAYMARLDALSGVRFLRLRKGTWAAAEGLVYEAWDRAVHLVNSFPIPADWRRLRVFDFGYTNPLVCQWWAIDPDGRMYLYREIYRTQRTVSAHAAQIRQLSAGERYEVNIADHDAEDRATLAAEGIPTVAAYKAVSRGIQAVEQRLQVAGDNKPRLFIMRDALVDRDEALEGAKKPVCTEHEFDSYVWPKGQDGKALREEPVKRDDHGMDAMRYAVMHFETKPELYFA